MTIPKITYFYRNEIQKFNHGRRPDGNWKNQTQYSSGSGF